MRTLILLIIACCCMNASAQNVETDSLKKQLAITQDDTKKVSVLESLSYAYVSSYPDTAMQYALQGLQLAQDIKYLKGEAICINALGNVYFSIGDNAKALEMYLRYLQLKERLKDYKNISVAYFNIAGAYTEDKDYRNALLYLFKAKSEDEQAKDSSAILYDLYSLASVYQRMLQNDSALYYINQSYRLVQNLDDKNMIGAVLNIFGDIHLSLNNTANAAAYYLQSLPHAEDVNDNEVITADYYGLAKIYKQKNMLDSSVYYARKAFSIAQKNTFFKQQNEISSFISGIFKLQHKYDSAFFYQELNTAIKDSLFNSEQLRKVNNLKLEEQQRQQAIETQKLQYRSTIKLFIAIAVSVIILIAAIFLWRSNRQTYKANLLLSEQKDKVEVALSELKSTQAQLIQSEKMASLGELTAGIAHEIQNPLNFVNNFSEINKELLEELKAEIENENMDEIKVIANDIIVNEEKINHHGKRADRIVKGMLQHSRINKGEKEPTDINALCNEYLRISYHGFRSKDKFFNAEIETYFDDTIEKINIIPQDMGRAFLNLFNNAFYSVNEKKKTVGTEYKPVVSVKTQKLNDKVLINIQDNGIGIPQNIIGKIFQPFFTTKPTGSGTGLGLSLVYDIITKEHEGSISVKSAGEETAFAIQLPLQK